MLGRSLESPSSHYHISLCVLEIVTVDLVQAVPMPACWAIIPLAGWLTGDLPGRAASAFRLSQAFPIPFPREEKRKRLLTKQAGRQQAEHFRVTTRIVQQLLRRPKNIVAVEFPATIQSTSGVVAPSSNDRASCDCHCLHACVLLLGWNG